MRISGKTVTASAVRRADRATEDRLRELGGLEGWQRLWYCAVRMDNTICCTRLLAFACQPLIDDLERDTNLNPQRWQFRCAGNLSL